MKKIFFYATLLWLFACNHQNEDGFSASVIAEGTAIKLSPQTGGQVLDIRFEEGTRVQAGDTLAVLDTEKLSYQLEQVQANVADVQAQKGIAATNLQKARDEAVYAKTRFIRVNDLYKQNAATEQMRDDAEINATRAESSMRSAQQMLASLDTRQAALQAQVNLLQKQISDATLISPLDGTVTTQYYQLGETVPTMAPMLEIINLQEMWAKVYVTETMLPAINIGQEAQISMDGTDENLVGRVAWISPRAEFTPKNILTEESRTGLVYAVKIDIDNPQGLLKHGMPVAISLPLVKK